MMVCLVAFLSLKQLKISVSETFKHIKYLLLQFQNQFSLSRAKILDLTKTR